MIDPIDGTKNYVRGVPVWATLIGLMVGGEVVVGVVSAPALGRRWWAARDGGAWTGRSPDQGLGVPGLRGAGAWRTPRCRTRAGAAGSDRAGSTASWPGPRCWRTRAYGDFWSHMLVAEGAVDVSAEPELSLWDMAALQVIVEEAGGAFTDLTGKPTPDGGSVVCSNGLLHAEVLDLLATR